MAMGSLNSEDWPCTAIQDPMTTNLTTTGTTSSLPTGAKICLSRSIILCLPLLSWTFHHPTSPLQYRPWQTHCHCSLWNSSTCSCTFSCEPGLGPRPSSCELESSSLSSGMDTTLLILNVLFCSSLFFAFFSWQ
jgi:hypothetical protein